MLKDPIENISQQYIERLADASGDAERDSTTAKKNLDTVAAAADAADAWRSLLHAYWINVKKTNKAYLSVDAVIEQLEILARVITGNVGVVSEAVETLVCVVRETSKTTDQLHRKLAELQKRLKSADPNNAYMKKIDEFGKKLDEALKSNAAAITAVLDLLKETYLLRFSLVDPAHIEEMGPHLDEHLHILEIGNQDWMEFFERIEVIEYIRKHKLGLENSVARLSRWLKEDNAFHITEEEAENPPLKLIRPSHVPTFPLNKEEYYKNMRLEEEEADEQLEHASRRKNRAIDADSAKKTRFDAIAAALGAASSARDKVK